MKIGDILHLEPTLEATSGLGTIGPIPATVIYVHPAGVLHGGVPQSYHRLQLAGGLLDETGTAAEELAGPAAFQGRKHCGLRIKPRGKR